MGASQFEKTNYGDGGGGLGERLGFNGIKVDIPVESIGGTLYLKQYADAILAMEARMEVHRPMPFVIMVSADTDGPTRASLEGIDIWVEGFSGACVTAGVGASGGR